MPPIVPQPGDPQPRRETLLRELAGLLLILAGVVGLAVAAFLVDALLGVAVLSGFSLAGGVVLSTREV